VEITVIDGNVEKAIKPSIKRKRKEKEAQRRLRKKMRAMKRFN